jgi:hypothetical protein
MATTGGGTFVLNIVELQNTITAASGLSPLATLQNTVSQIQEMVIYDEKRIAVNTISKFNQIPIQVVDPINIGPTGGLTVGGSTVSSGASGTGPTGAIGPTGSTPPVYKSAIVNQAATTIVSMNTLKAYMSTSGAIWLGSNTGGAINVYGQATWTIYGLDPLGSTISLPSLNSMTSAAPTPGSGHRGDLVVAVVTDTTNSYVYRVTGQQFGTSVSGNYSVIIEQLV